MVGCVKESLICLKQSLTFAKQPLKPWPHVAKYTAETRKGC